MWMLAPHFWTSFRKTNQSKKHEQDQRSYILPYILPTILAIKYKKTFYKKNYRYTMKVMKF